MSQAFCLTFDSDTPLHAISQAMNQTNLRPQSISAGHHHDDAFLSETLNTAVWQHETGRTHCSYQNATRNLTHQDFYRLPPEQQQASTHAMQRMILNTRQP